MKKYNVNFKGYWLDENKGSIPNSSGVYLVYRCKFNETVNKVSLIEIIYIGQATDLQERIKNHDKRVSFLSTCKNQEKLCYSIAEIESQNLNIIENALIFAQQPGLNEQYKDNFNYEESAFDLDGACALMKHTNFTIK